MDAEQDAPEGDEQPSAASMEELGRKWMERIRSAQKREERWRREAEKAEKAYLNDEESDAEGKTYDFNILHSNVETIVPSLYNSTPAPDIRERFRVGPESPETNTARTVAQIYERGISYYIDDSKLDAEMEALAQDAFVAGRGILRLRFNADVMPGPEGQQIVTNERVEYEAVSWRDYCEGPAQRWGDVPWVAFASSVPEEEVERIRDPEIKAKLATGRDPSAEPVLSEGGDDGDVRLWQIWDKDRKRVLMLVEHSAEILSMRPDPLQLPQFFPMCPPVQPIVATNRRMPVSPFTIYRKLADELERITRRINAIIDGLRVRGIISADVAAIEALADAEDNTLIPVQNIEGLAQQGGLEKAIAWWPIQHAITVLRELYSAREQTKTQIYEITGISDIIRGQGKASETATAQNIKTQWGSLRIKRLQRLIERTVRSAFVLTAELMSTKVSPQTLQKISGIEVPPDAAQMLQAPLDHYRVDVESDSTVRADLARQREEMAGFLQGTGQFFGVMGPLIKEKPELAAPAAEIYAAFARIFSLGKQAEDAIEGMTQMARQAAAQHGQQPKPEEKAEQAKMQVEMQKLQMEAQGMGMENQLKQAEMQIKQQELAIKQQELQIKRAELQLKQRELELKGQQMLIDATQEAPANGYV